MKTAMSGFTDTVLPTSSTVSGLSGFTVRDPIAFSVSWMACICWDTADNIFSSSLLNSSKQPQAPTWHNPTKILPMAWKSKVSSQLNTRTKRPSWLPRDFTDSVFPVPNQKQVTQSFLYVKIMFCPTWREGFSDPVKRKSGFTRIRD